MKKLLTATALILSLTACGSWQNDVGRMGADARTGDYKVTLYSGGTAVKTWDLKDSYVSASDGGFWFFFDQNGKFVRISGDVLIEEQ